MGLSHQAGEASPVRKYAFTRIYTIQSHEREGETIWSVAELHGENIELVLPVWILKSVRSKKIRKERDRYFLKPLMSAGAAALTGTLKCRHCDQPAKSKRGPNIWTLIMVRLPLLLVSSRIQKNKTMCPLCLLNRITKSFLKSIKMEGERKCPSLRDIKENITYSTSSQTDRLITTQRKGSNISVGDRWRGTQPLALA